MNYKRYRSALVTTTRMRNRLRKVMTPLLATGIAGLSSIAPAAEYVLTGLGTTNEDVPIDHGSNGEVTLIWPDTWDQYTDWDGRGDVYQVDQPIVTVDLFPVALTDRLRITSFDLDEWVGGNDTSALWSVEGSESGIITSGTWDDFNSAKDPLDLGGRSKVMVNAIGRPGESLTLKIDHTGLGRVSYLAMDNLTFSIFDGFAVGDINQDGTVDAGDAALMFANWASSGVGDLNNDGIVDAGDAGEMFANWTGDSGPQSGVVANAVPEPQSGLALWQGVVGLGALAMKRKRQANA